MAILKIARMGHPVLRGRAEPVGDPTTADLRRLIADMIETMHDAGGAGLAAPQVHVPLRLFVFQVPEARAGGGLDDEALGVQVLVDPALSVLDATEQTGWEGCLSIPGLQAVVPRHARVRYAGLDAEGQPVEREAAGFHARVVQHENDHLDGILYPMRMTDFSKFGFVDELARHGEPS